MSEATAPLTASPSEAERRAGFLSAVSAYIVWGFLPLYLKLLHTVDVREVLAQRVLWAAPSALIAVFVMSGWRSGLREIATAFKPRMLGTLTISACFIFVNWGLYVYLVLNERVIESALAYFLAPLVAVAVGVLFFGEKIRSLRSSLSLSRLSACSSKALRSARRRGWRWRCALRGLHMTSFANARRFPRLSAC